MAMLLAIRYPTPMNWDSIRQEPAFWFWALQQSAFACECRVAGRSSKILHKMQSNSAKTSIAN